MERFLFHLTGAWTFSKLFPYFFVFIVFFAFSYILFRKRSVLAKFLFSLFAGGAAFGIYFAFNIIYLSDIENNYRKYVDSNFVQLKSDHFYVLSIPGCEYCKESIGFMEEYINNSDVDSVTYLICDSTTWDYSNYKAIAPTNFAFIQGESISRLVEMADYSFPSFMYVDAEGVIYVWNNNDFGVRAKDFIKKNRP